MGPTTIVMFAVGVVTLVAGAEGMVRGAARLATRTGLSPIVIGLTVVAFGTSAPELAVSVGAALNNEADLAIGNVVGSNIANVLLVLGLAAVVGGGLVVAQRIVRVDVPLVIGASILVMLLSLNNKLGRLEGAVLVALLVVYVIWTIRGAQRGKAPHVEAEYSEALDHEKVKEVSVWADIGYVAAGLVLLVVGAQALVGAATDIAVNLGVSQLVIGLTVVAVGTSLPEIATSILAAARGERDLAVGNAIGSNLFNLLAVLGITALVSPQAMNVLQGAITVDMPVMIAAAIACLPLFATGYVLERWEGAVFFGFYTAYVSWLVLDATDHGLRDSYRSAMLLFVLPLVVLTMAVILGREWRRRRGELGRI
jgi:cation:H+ antiporter